MGSSDLTYSKPYCYYPVDFKSKKATYRLCFQEFKWFSICTKSWAAGFTNVGSGCGESHCVQKKCAHWTQSGQSLAQKFCYANHLPKEVEASWKRKWFKIQHAATWIISRSFTMKGDTMQHGLFLILILSLVMTRIRAEVEQQRDGKGIYHDYFLKLLWKIPFSTNDNRNKRCNKPFYVTVFLQFFLYSTWFNSKMKHV